jgi:hypothetical protein
LAFDAEPKDLSKAFKKFGEISMAVIVKDKNTGMSKGTGFVKFVTKGVKSRKYVMVDPVEFVIEEA